MILPLPRKHQIIAVTKATAQRLLLLFCVCLTYASASAQVQNTGMTDEQDSLELGKLKVSGLVDVYYLNDFHVVGATDRPYASSSARLLEFTVNMAYLDLDYRTEKVRARFVPGFGTYINTNNILEPGSLKNILEANAGIKLSRKKDIWFDAGIFGAPFTNETAISKNQNIYTRSLAAENSPYYLSGVRLTYPLSAKTNFYFYMVNGWQQMADRNKPLSICTQVEYRPTNKLLFNWSTYVGSEQTPQTPTYRNRYFNDLYVIFEPSKKWSFTACASHGLQEKRDTLTQQLPMHTWWQLNGTAKYLVKPNFFVSARAEYYEDLKQTIVVSKTSVQSFNAFSETLSLNWKVSRNALLRLEGRRYHSDRAVFPVEDGGQRKTYNLLSANICVWF